jgi:hypothetical protein
MKPDKQVRLLAGVRRGLSDTRLDAYGIGRSDEEKLANYLWNVALCESLYPALHGLEIALRNAVFRAGAAAFPSVATIDVACWLDADPPLIHPVDLHMITEAKARLRSQQKPAQTGPLIADLRFGFWTTLFDVRYERSRTLWPRLLAHGLLDYTSPRSVRTRKALSPMLNRVRHLRNRVFHHEPVWHWRDLHDQHALALDLLAWLSPELQSVLLPQVRFEVVHRTGVAPFREQVNTLLASDDPADPQ